MKYRVTCLTPTLVGDGQWLAPIDYMVWKDHVNVLDQKRIFRLLAKGPRLEGYLAQLKKAEKLDFGSWGGFAQNFAGRRIPFEHASSTQYWEKARAEHLFIPTFAEGPSGAYLPGAALKGALRTGLVHSRVTESMLRDAGSRASSEGRLPRRPGESIEAATLGSGGADSMRVVSVYDSRPLPADRFKVYMLRVSTLEARGGKYEVAWKLNPRGSSKRPDDSTPIFAEMAAPGVAFEGEWRMNEFLSQPEIAKSLRKRQQIDVPGLCAAVNGYAEQVLKIQMQYAEWSGLPLLAANLSSLQSQLEKIRPAGTACLLALGWGAGFLSKAAVLSTQDENYRQVLKQVPLYARAIQSGLPFPKTRKIVFLGNQPATVPGFVRLEVLSS